MSRVFAIIPVFNRLNDTRSCVQLLKKQSYPDIEIIIADGGSSDGTPEKIAAEFPGVTVIRCGKDVWWTGSMAAGIRHTLATSKSDQDFVLMMNNDTTFDESFVQILVDQSNKNKAAVGALPVDAAHPERVLDAGVLIDWEKCEFHTRREISPGEKYYDQISTLPGRGSLVPLYMIKKAGNVDEKNFPHYIADYEFFARLNRHGFNLGISYEAKIYSDTKTTGAVMGGKTATLTQYLKFLFSRRSKNNFIARYRFFRNAAPDEFATRAQREILRQTLADGKIALRESVKVLGRFSIFMASPPLFVFRKDCQHFDLDPADLVKKGVLLPEDEVGRFFFPARVKLGKLRDPKHTELYSHAQKSGQRATRDPMLLQKLAGR